jgi:serine/threonine-protein kinase
LAPVPPYERRTIKRLIQAGGMGEVYEATHDFTGREEAVKLLLASRADEEFRGRMIKEAKLLCGMDHPNIVKAYDAGISENRIVWIAMELLKGMTLRQEMRQHTRMPIAKMLRIARDIVDAAAAMHAVGIVHRDLKPENIFVTETGEVKVLDLGAAKLYGAGLHSTGPLRVIGTLHYMAPEHIRGERVDARADIYAIGVILYEIAANRHPFASMEDGGELPGMQEIAHRQMFGAPRPLPEIREGFPAELWAIYKRALAKDREYRFGSAEELGAALKGFYKRYRDASGVDEISSGDREKPIAPVTCEATAPESPTEKLPAAPIAQPLRSPSGAGTDVMTLTDHDAASSRPVLVGELAGSAEPPKKRARRSAEAEEQSTLPLSRDLLPRVTPEQERRNQKPASTKERSKRSGLSALPRANLSLVAKAMAAGACIALSIVVVSIAIRPVQLVATTPAPAAVANQALPPKAAVPPILTAETQARAEMPSRPASADERVAPASATPAPKPRRAIGPGKAPQSGRVEAPAPPPPRSSSTSSVKASRIF